MRRFSAALSCSLLLAACNDAGLPPAAPPTMAAAPVTTVVLDAGAAATTAASAEVPTPAPTAPPAASSASANAGGDANPDFFACNTDSDCTAVAKVGCCQNGYLEAVNKQSASAYRASFVCGQKRPICPMYRITDKRLPVCGSTSHKCELLRPDQFTCSGSGPSVHACASGLTCDAGGHCTPAP
jgi:hypothetical protein